MVACSRRNRSAGRELFNDGADVLELALSA
jgi:hypothetical protein